LETEIVPIESNELAPAPVSGMGASDLLDHWLGSLGPHTVRGYGSDLDQFARAILAVDRTHAVAELLALTAGEANALVLAYRNRMVRDDLASATIARRLAALRSVVALAGILGMIAWSIGIKAPKAERRRDVRGPDKGERKRLWRYLRSLDDSPRNRRDRALIALLFDLALRRAEVLALHLADFDRLEGAVMVLGKGRREKSRLTLPAPTRAALEAWLEARGVAPGPLFDLTSDGVAHVIRTVGAHAGLDRRLRPHGLRHAAITAALDSGSDIREVRKFSRHAKLETVIQYDDARDDTAGKIASNVSRERK
jgi:integrase/recombinase XerC